MTDRQILQQTDTASLRGVVDSRASWINETDINLLIRGWERARGKNSVQIFEQVYIENGQLVLIISPLTGETGEIRIDLTDFANMIEVNAEVKQILIERGILNNVDLDDMSRALH